MGLREPAMEDENELVADLVELGLTRNEARLYLAASGRPALRAAELAELAGVTRTKAYDGLHQLVDKGLLRQRPGRAARFEAAEPELLARRLRQRSIEDQATLVRDTGALVADLFARYYAAPASDQPFDFVELIRNRDAASARREAIVAGARAEVVSASRRAPGAAGRADAAAGRRAGVRSRSLYETGFLDDQGFRAEVAERLGRGEEIRVVERVPVGLCVVDRRTSLLSLNPAAVTSGPGTWIVLEHQGLAATLTDAFDLAWARGTPVPG
jgi:HTH-type transcriptional regulator, sugar sensing transcriptional regulator